MDFSESMYLFRELQLFYLLPEVAGGVYLPFQRVAIILFTCGSCERCVLFSFLCRNVFFGMYVPFQRVAIILFTSGSCARGAYLHVSFAVMCFFRMYIPFQRVAIILFTSRSYERSDLRCRQSIVD